VTEEDSALIPRSIDKVSLVRRDRVSPKIAITLLLCVLECLLVTAAADTRLNVTIGSTGNLTSDGKGMYYTGTDGLAAWLDPARFPTMSFDICTNWPFWKHPGVNSSASPPPTGLPSGRRLIHRITDPVPDGGGKSLGVFDSPYGNDVTISNPVAFGVNSFLDMRVGSNVSPDSGEVRFGNADATEYYSLIFGAGSLFYPDMSLHGKGTTKPSVTRVSERTWRISFPAKTIGRLWRRSGELTDLGLYYYEGMIDVQLQ
jgi:hypothetical protein